MMTRQQQKIWSGIVDLMRAENSTHGGSAQKPGFVHHLAPSSLTERQCKEPPEDTDPPVAVKNHPVAVLDRISPDVIVVSWRDPQRCCYAEQLWRLRQAPYPGRCALSGLTITTGSPVFMPSSRPRAANANEMILPAALPGEERLLSDSSCPDLATQDDDDM